MRLSAWIEEFLLSLRVERGATPRTVETYRWCLRDFEVFAGKQNGGTVLITHFTEETCRAYQYDLAARGLQPNSIRVRLATLGSLGRWALNAVGSLAIPSISSLGHVERRGSPAYHGGRWSSACSPKASGLVIGR
jgi:site-specific recombinase XerD